MQSAAAARLPLSALPAAMTRLWRGLDRLYLLCGYLAALSMVAIFVITLAQIAGRYFGFNLRGSTDYAGYFMAASAFLSFAYALNRGSQVRIELFLQMSGRCRPWLEKLSLLASTVIAVWFAYHSCSMVYWSYILGDVSQGLDATPMWIPQISMAAGAFLLALAVADHSLRLLITGSHGIETAADPT
jgi:TRAP-type C4-dicarboxylate transport system permease small subunit